MKTREEIRNWLLENAVDEDGDLMLDSLDFSEFGGDVYISDMKVKGDLFQDDQEVQGSLFQNRHKVQGNLYQNGHEVKGNLKHGNSRYGGNLYEFPYSKSLKEITSEELAKLGYKLKKEGEI